MHKRTFFRVLLLGPLTVALALHSCKESADEQYQAAASWREYLGGPHRSHYSSLKQINVANVGQLEIAWTYELGDTSNIETNPIIIGDTLFGKSASGLPFAVNAATGQEYWKIQGEKFSMSSNSRGVNYWEEGEDRRVLYTHGHWLYSVNATTGDLVPSFGGSGRVSLKTGLRPEAHDKMVISTSPGTIFDSLIIMPLRVIEGEGAAKGYIQAFNVKSGHLAWVFKTIPEPGEFGYDTWPADAYKDTDIGGVNNWSGMAIDRKRGMVYIPIGSPAFDYYGGNRIGKNVFASSLLALDAATGKRIWVHQIVHHDIFDRDLPAPPSLLTVTQNGKKVDAVAQITKHGYVFIFNRETGEPLFPIEERPVPASHVPGEQAWPTQPFPTKPAPFARVELTEKNINTRAANYEELLKIFRRSRTEGPFTPPGLRQNAFIFPGLDGGGEWGGAATDPEGILYVNSSAVPWYLQLVPKFEEEELKALSSGHRLFLTTCSQCHGTDLKGEENAGIPALVDIGQRRSKPYVAEVMSNGKGMMPAFGSTLSKAQRQAIVDYVFDPKKEGGNKSQVATTNGKQKDKNKSKIPYKIYHTRFATSDGYPAINPPWGTLTAINMNTGELVWRDTLGTHPELKEKYGTAKTGALNFGGPIVTAGNLLFIASTSDSLLKAYDKRDGRLIWKTKLPSPGFATPATYQVHGKQYVVIACGGSGQLGIKANIIYVAYALPD